MNRIQSIIYGFLTIAEGIVIVSTLGYYFPTWTFTYLAHCTVKSVKQDDF